MWLRNLFDSVKLGRSRTPIQQARRGTPPRQPTSRRLAVEALEDRCVPAAWFSVGDATILEGSAGSHHAEVVVSMTEPHRNRVSVNYRTAHGTASAGSDYDAVSGKLTFAKGETSKMILVPVRGDRVFEPDEHFFVQLYHAKGAKIANCQGVVTIVDDEPRISISDVSALEGNSGTTAFTFIVSLSAASDLPVTVNYASTDGSASAGSDYTAASGTVTFNAGQTSQTITVLVSGDRLHELDKDLLVSLSSASSNAEISKGVGVGTILDDEPRISIAGAYNYGETSFTFTVGLAAAYDQVVTVDFATTDGTAIAGVDYVATFGTLTFDIGATTKTITVEVIDPTSAPDKYFYVHLSGASSNALISNEWAAGYWYYDYGYYDYGYYDYGYYDYGYYYGDYYDYGYYY